MPAFDDPAERAQHVGLVAEVARSVAVLPVAEAAEALEVLSLALDLLVGILAALLTESSCIDRVSDLADLLFDLQLDRQSVAIPARHVGCSKPGQQCRTDHEVLQNLVDRVADVDVAVGVRRAVMQHEAVRPVGGGALDRTVQVAGVPVSQHAGFAGRKRCLHRKIRIGQVDRVFVVHGPVAMSREACMVYGIDVMVRNLELASFRDSFGNPQNLPGLAGILVHLGGHGCKRVEMPFMTDEAGKFDGQMVAVK